MGIRVAATSRTLSHQEEDFDEYLDLYISGYVAYYGLRWLAFLRKYMKVNLFPRKFRPTVEALATASLLHISGGGNINSIWAGHLFYRALMISIARLYDIPVIMTGQTIGPISRTFHRNLLASALRSVAYIGVRDQSDSVRELKLLHLKKTVIVVAPDDAMFALPAQLHEDRKKEEHIIRVGLSLHEWSVDENELQQQLHVLAAMTPRMRFVLIPHVVYPSGKDDLEFMQRVTRTIDPSRIETCTLPGSEEKFSIRHLVNLVTRETAQIDLVVATRYHAIVFALSSGVPAVACFGDEYYRIKNEGVLDMFFEDPEVYELDLRSVKKGDLARSATEIFANRQEVTSRLHQKMLSWGSDRDEYYCNLYNTYALCN